MSHITKIKTKIKQFNMQILLNALNLMKKIATFNLKIIGYRENVLIESAGRDFTVVSKGIIIAVGDRKFAITEDGRIVGDFWRMPFTQEQLTNLIVNTYLTSAVIEYAKQMGQTAQVSYDKSSDQFNVIVSSY